MKLCVHNLKSCTGTGKTLTLVKVACWQGSWLLEADETEEGVTGKSMMDWVVMSWVRILALAKFFTVKFPLNIFLFHLFSMSNSFER